MINVGGDLAEVVIAAAILARQLGVDLNREIEAKLGSPTWQARARDYPARPARNAISADRV